LQQDRSRCKRDSYNSRGWGGSTRVFHGLLLVVGQLALFLSSGPAALLKNVGTVGKAGLHLKQKDQQRRDPGQKGLTRRVVPVVAIQGNRAAAQEQIRAATWPRPHRPGENCGKRMMGPTEGSRRVSPRVRRPAVRDQIDPARLNGERLDAQDDGKGRPVLGPGDRDGHDGLRSIQPTRNNQNTPQPGSGSRKSARDRGTGSGATRAGASACGNPAGGNAWSADPPKHRATGNCPPGNDTSGAGPAGGNATRKCPTSGPRSTGSNRSDSARGCGARKPFAGRGSPWWRFAGRSRASRRSWSWRTVPRWSWSRWSWSWRTVPGRA